MSQAMESGTRTSTGEAVREAGATGVVVSKAEIPRAELTQGSNVTSTFWAYDDSWRSRGTNARTIGFPAPVIVNSFSQVAVSVCELGADNVPFLGNAEMSILNVVPHDDGTVDLRWHVGWDEKLPVRLNFVIVN